MDNNFTNSILENGIKNREYLMSELQKKIEEMEEIEIKLKEEMNNFLEEAKALDINFSPDNTILENSENSLNSRNIYSWIKISKNAKEKLSNLKLNEDTIFEEDEYIKTAQKLLDKIDSEIKIIVIKFKEENRNRLNSAKEQKVKTRRELDDLEIELNELKAREENLQKEEDNLNGKLIKGKKTKERIQSIEKEIEEIKSQIEEKNKRNFELEQIEKANHFTYSMGNKPTDQPENKNNAVAKENIEK